MNMNVDALLCLIQDFLFPSLVSFLHFTHCDLENANKVNDDSSVSNFSIRMFSVIVYYDVTSPARHYHREKNLSRVFFVRDILSPIIRSSDDLKGAHLVW